MAEPRRRVCLDGSEWRGLWRALRHPVRFVVGLVRRVSADDAVTTAAALAYYFLSALFPLVLFLLAFVTLLPVHGLEEWLLASAREWVPGEAFDVVSGVVSGFLARPRTGLVSLGMGLALWSASTGFVGVMRGLSKAYGVPDGRPWWRLRLQAMGLTIALSGFMVVAFVLGIFGGELATFVGGFGGDLGIAAALAARWVIAIGCVAVVVAALYHFGPDAERSWRWVTPGTLFFLGGFGGTARAFAAYVERFGRYDKTYGSLGAVIVLLLWMYLLAFFLLLGGELDGHLLQVDAAHDAGATLATPPRAVEG